MMFESGFLGDLRNDLTNVLPIIKAKLNRKGALTEDKLLSLVFGTSSDDLVEVEHALVGDVTN